MRLGELFCYSLYSCVGSVPLYVDDHICEEQQIKEKRDYEYKCKIENCTYLYIHIFI